MLAEPTLIEQLWPKLWPLIKKSVLDFDLETEEDVKEDLISGSRLLLICGDAVAVFRFCGNRKKFVEINYVGGKHIKKYWPQMISMLMTAGKEMGCDKVVSFGRKAWQKIDPEVKGKDCMMYVRGIHA